MLASITGTPGTGKTSLGRTLASRGYEVVSLNSLLEDTGQLNCFDKEHGSFEIDVTILKELQVREGEITFIEGHLTHHLDCDISIVLRCDPVVIRERLSHRGYSEKKISENVDSEIIDLILIESLQNGVATYEIDCTCLELDEVADSVVEIINGKGDAYLPGRINWIGDL